CTLTLARSLLHAHYCTLAHRRCPTGAHNLSSIKILIWVLLMFPTILLYQMANWPAQGFHGFEALSLPPEGIFDFVEDFYAVTQRHAGFAGYTIIQSKDREMKDKGFRWTNVLVCKHGGMPY